MTERFTINKGEQVFNIYAPVDGEEACGKNGQIKGASCFGRTITLGGQELNRGSTIDFLREQVIEYNTQHADQLDLPEKGWFFGFCGTSTEDIEGIFNTLYPNNPIPVEQPTLEDAIEAANRADVHAEAGRPDEAAILYKYAADLGDNYSSCKLAYFYMEGLGVDKDINKALEYFSKVAPSSQEDFPYAQFCIGYIYERGEDVHEDIACALDHYMQSARWKDSEYAEKSIERIKALASSDEIYAKGIEYLRTENQERGKNFLLYVAMEGFSQAHIDLAEFYRDKEMHDQALVHYTSAAHLSAQGMYLAGEFFENCEAIKNRFTARDFYQQAADLGHTLAAQAVARLNSATG